MIAPSQERISSEKITAPDPAASQRPTPLPGFQRLLLAAVFVNAPFVGLSLLLGKIWLGGSLIAGLVISLTACGLLHAFVEKIMPLFVAGVQGQTARSANNGAVMQFFALVIVKFLALSLAGYAILNFHQMNLPAVLVGFSLAQTAIVVTVARHLKSH